MARVTLTADQAATIKNAYEQVELRAPDGSLLGYVDPLDCFIVPEKCPFSLEEIAAALESSSSSERWYTTEEVLSHLRSLGETPQ